MALDGLASRRLLDEYTSIFINALRPDVRIGAVEWKRVVGVLDHGIKADAVFRVARYFAQRFSAAVELLYPPGLEVGHSVPIPLRALPRWSPDALLAALAAAEPFLVIAPCPLLDASDAADAGRHEQDTLGRMLDVLLRNTAAPVLLLETPAVDPERMCRDIMVVVPDALDATRPLAAAFSLAEKNGTILLFHVIESGLVERCRQVLRRIPWIDTRRGGEAVEQVLHDQAEQTLRIAEELAAGCGAAVTSQIAMGDPVEAAARRVAGGEFGLLVAPLSRARKDPLGALAYNLALSVTTVPVLVL